MKGQPGTQLGIPERHALQRRSLHVLMVGQALGFGALATVASFTGLLAAEILGGDLLAGLPSAFLTLASAAFSPALARLSLREGRRRGLWAGSLIGALGGLIAAGAGRFGSFLLLLFGMLAAGAGQAALLQIRYAATDLAEPDRRSQAIASVVWVGTIGAVAGPFLGEWSNSLTWGRYTGPMLLGGLFYLLAAAVVGKWLRPDPLVIAGGLRLDSDASTPLAGLGANLWLLWCNQSARIATAAMVVSQVAMVSVMVMSPLHMKDHGQAGLAGPLIALHVVGMFGLSPLVGRWADRYGATRMIVAGGWILATGTVMTVVAGYVPALLFGGLFLVGLGFSFGFIAGSSLLTSSVGPARRVAAQGTSDLVVSALSALAAFGSGFVKATAGYHWLANGATTLALLLVVATVAASRRKKEVPAHATT